MSTWTRSNLRSLRFLGRSSISTKPSALPSTVASTVAPTVGWTVASTLPSKVPSTLPSTEPMFSRARRLWQQISCVRFRGYPNRRRRAPSPHLVASGLNPSACFFLNALNFASCATPSPLSPSRETSATPLPLLPPRNLVCTANGKVNAGVRRAN